MAILTMIFNRLRIPIATYKTVGPTVQLQYLGIILDTDSMEARLPLDKLTRIREMLHQFESKQRVSTELVGPFKFCIQSNQRRTKLRVLPPCFGSLS